MLAFRLMLLLTHRHWAPTRFRHPEALAKRASKGDGPARAAILRGPRFARAPQDDGQRQVRPLAVVLVLAVTAGLVPAAAQAPQPSDTIKAMVGAWELSNADRDKTCTVNFRIAPAGANYAAELEKKCGDAFPATRGIVAWTIGRNDMLLLVDAAGKPVLELLEVEAGMYEGLRPNEERYFLQNAAVAAASRARPAA